MARDRKLDKPTSDDREIGADHEITSYAFGVNTTEIFNLVEDEVTQDQLEDMIRKDGQARSLFRLVTLPMRACVTNVSVEPDEGGEAEADFIRDMLLLPAEDGGMEVSFQTVMSQVFLAIAFGYSPFEIVVHSPTEGSLKGKWTLRKLAYRPSKTVKFAITPEGQFNGFVQRATVNGMMEEVHIPADRAWYFACQEEENPFYGLSFFMPAFFHYDKKQKLYYISHIAASFRAVPARVVKFPGSIGKVRLRIDPSAARHMIHKRARTRNPVRSSCCPLNKAKAN